jgi:energy-converting hydrogenase Eha subunit E
MSPRCRKLVLTSHLVTSVGWLGAVLVFLALGVTATASRDIQTVRAVYLVLEPAGWAALVPLAVASLATGLIQSLGTVWGLFRHYWVIFKLAINLGAVGVLLLYMQTLAFLADVAEGDTLTSDQEVLLRSRSVTLHSVLALVLLVIATILAVYKPRGMTSHGRRRQGRLGPFGRQRTITSSAR